MFIVNNKTFFFWLSGILVLLSVGSIAIFGLKYGIEFTGGTLVEVEYPEGRPSIDEVKSHLDKLEWHGTLVQATGEKGVIVRTQALKEKEHEKLVAALSNDGVYKVEEKRLDSVGPIVGEELKSKAGWAIVIVILAIVLYIAFAFRHVSQPVSSWVYGFVAVVALVHDVLIPTGVYVVLSHYFLNVQIDVLFVMAILTILGFSVHDTIVVFDRTRENLKLRTWKEFTSTVGHSLEQTMTRSVNTSVTVLLVTLALYFMGGETTKNFALILAIGIAVGTYSSIFVASPLLVAIEEWQRKKEEKSAALHQRKK
jgi:preprotein translocase subunit SecF